MPLTLAGGSWKNEVMLMKKEEHSVHLLWMVRAGLSELVMAGSVLDGTWS